MSTIFLPPSVAMDNRRNVPEWFSIALKNIDPSLIVYWNPLRCRWIIDRCTRAGVHEVADHPHTPECPRTNVKVVQGEMGEYMPLCQEVLDWLKAHDTWNQHNSADALIKHLANEDEAYQEKLKRERRDNTRAHTLDGKRQIQQAKNLIDQHDLEPNQ